MARLLAADDWGLSPAVNEAILALAERGLVGSVSVLTNLPYWRQGLARLGELGVPLELHWNLTLGRPVRGAAVPSLTDERGCFLPLPRLLRRLALGRVRRAELTAEAEAQLALLRGAGIARVNGHEHVHLVPGIAGTLARVARENGIAEVRWVVDPAHWPTRLTRPFCAGAWRGFRRMPTLVLWPTRARSPAELRAKLSQAREGLLIVHPSARDDFSALEFADGLRGERVREFEALRGLA